MKLARGRRGARRVASTEAPVHALYLCYLSIEEPLVETQVIAYLRGLARAGHVIHLLTFDTKALSSEQRRARRAELAADGIHWHRLRYHKRPSLPATGYDVAAGIVYGAWLCSRHRLDTVHARNHVPGAMALPLRRLLGLRLVFDLRGLMAEEYEDSGIWDRCSVASRVTKWVERRCLAQADGIVVLTERIRRQLLPRPRPNVWVIPCCADLELINRQRHRREEIRQRLALGNRPVLAYIGKFGGWYLVAEMIEFFLVARTVIDGLFFLVLTQSDHQLILEELAHRDISRTSVAVRSVEPAEVGAYLAASDLAISFLRPSRATAGCSPTKLGEYLAAGLPVVATAGVGDVDELLAGTGSGMVLPDLGPAAYRAASRELLRLARDPATSARCRSTAREALSLPGTGIPRYLGLYAGLTGDVVGGRRGVMSRRRPR